jgi:hypothetical protein
LVINLPVFHNITSQNAVHFARSHPIYTDGVWKLIHDLQILWCTRN